MNEIDLNENAKEILRNVRTDVRYETDTMPIIPICEVLDYERDLIGVRIDDRDKQYPVLTTTYNTLLRRLAE
jgi:hypothetical protein